MKLNVTAFALAVGLVWGAAMFVVGAANLMWPGYGNAFLTLAASIYPGYRPGTGMGSVVMGTLYGLVDSTIGGAVLAWLYNLLAGLRSGGKT